MNATTFSRSVLLKSINLLLFIGSAFMLSTGLALELRLPRGQGGHGLELLGLGRHDWGALHWWVGVAMGILVLVHLAMHWKWIQRAVAGAAHRAGVIGILVALVLFLVPLLAPVTGR